MIRAVVTGNVWATRRITGVPSGAFLEVEEIDSGSTSIAFDVLGSGVGEHVLVAHGSVAANWFTGPPPPIDALIIGSIDRRVDGADTTSDSTDNVPEPSKPRRKPRS